MLGAGYWVLGAGCWVWVLGAGCWVLAQPLLVPPTQKCQPAPTHPMGLLGWGSAYVALPKISPQGFRLSVSCAVRRRPAGFVRLEDALSKETQQNCVPCGAGPQALVGRVTRAKTKESLQNCAPCGGGPQALEGLHKPPQKKTNRMKLCVVRPQSVGWYIGGQPAS